VAGVLAFMIVIAQCTGSKLGVECEAQEMYTASPYFCKQRNYAENMADRWFIQSAKYGLLEPTDVITPYNTHAKDIDDPEAWAKDIAHNLHAQVPTGATVQLLGGKHYVNPLVPILERYGYIVETPLSGLGIGERMAELERLQNKGLENYA